MAGTSLLSDINGFVRCTHFYRRIVIMEEPTQVFCKGKFVRSFFFGLMTFT